MKAAVYYHTGPPDVFRYEDVPDPQCGPGSVLIDVAAISIEGGDIGNRAGGAMATEPHIVGYQCAGTIREVGEHVTDRKAGQRVVAVNFFGSHAEMIAVPWQTTWLLPDDLTTEEGACIPVAYGTAHACLFTFGHLTDGESVLIQGGAGGVGIAAIQMAKRAGATTLATASSDEKLERLKTEFGLDHGVNYAQVELVEEVRRLTNGRGVDLAVDSVGSTLLGSIESLAYRGRCITVGDMARGRRPLDTSVLMERNLTLTGVFLGAELMLGDGHDIVQSIIDDVARGDLRVAIDRTFPLSDAAAAHEYIESRRAFGRVVLVP
ncbi:MAG TPA: zinc-binding alcohol dehydrogenase family protein [Actinomycetota bacterium]|jgi:NADPH2:quinone reductase|nr:zinc-binding alcohol dehydrogenase family protein [Actinomycetota bacterium]